MDIMLMGFFFVFWFLIIILIFNKTIFMNKRINRRIKYYFDIEKNNISIRQKIINIKSEKKKLKKLNEIIKEKLSGINQDENDQLLRGAGVNLSSEEYTMMKLLFAAIAGGILFLISNKFFLFIPGAVIGYILPNLWIKRKRKIRIKEFNDGLPDMISTIIGSLRSGYSLPQSLKTVAEECDSPVKEEIIFLLKEMNYGVTLEDALNNLNTRMPSQDLELMTEAILIQRQVGGNLAGVLEIILKTIRDRIRIQGQIKTLTSQGRLSGKVIGALPIVLGLSIYLLNPDFMTPLFSSTLGRILISAGVVSGIIGFVLINKLTKVEV